MADGAAFCVTLQSIAYARRLLTARFVLCFREPRFFAAEAGLPILDDSRLTFSPNPASRKARSTRAL
jgi:hypothetical protein